MSEEIKDEHNNKILNSFVGEKIEKIEGCEIDSDSMTITFASGRFLRLWHRQDCCESVAINDVIGDPQDLIGRNLNLCMEIYREAEGDEVTEYGTWTFYKFAAEGHYLTLRWLGESNGYYSMSVDIEAGNVNLVN